MLNFSTKPVELPGSCSAIPVRVVKLLNDIWNGIISMFSTASL